MKHLTTKFLICILLMGSHARAQEAERVPTFARLEAVAGAHVEGEEFAELLRDFDFSVNPKRERSWGSGFGVFLEQSNSGIVSVGIRPPSRKTNLPTYPGKLPKQLAATDSVEIIQQKLGKPERIVELEDAHLVMYYDGFRVVTLGGRLFEIWLTEFTEKVESPDASRNLKTRFGDAEPSARTQ